MTDLERAVIEWRDARKVIIAGGTSVPTEAWTRLANAETALMQLAVKL